MGPGIAWLMILSGLLVVQFLFWVVYRVRGNAAIVDVGWTLGIGLAALFLVLAGPRPARVSDFILAAMILLWSLRLGLHLVRRVSRGPEDPRFSDLRRRLGRYAPWAFFLIFELEGLMGSVFVLPLLFVVWSPSPGARIWLWVGVLVWLLGWLGESQADRQLVHFKKSPEGQKGGVCRAGWWAYSRHPNYFFEWLVWIGIALFASGARDGVWSWICPALMLGLLLKGSGIPPTEAQALKTRGEAYRRYQEEVSSFIPWGPRRPG
jgi:steroid 5-alpha reductase family enzyme